MYLGEQGNLGSNTTFCISHDVNTISAKQSSNFRSTSGQNLSPNYLWLRWKNMKNGKLMNHSVKSGPRRETEHYYVARAEVKCVLGGQECKRAGGGDSEWRGRTGERGRAAEGGVKGRDPDTCSYLNFRLLAEVTAGSPLFSWVMSSQPGQLGAPKSLRRSLSHTHTHDGSFGAVWARYWLDWADFSPGKVFIRDTSAVYSERLLKWKRGGGFYFWAFYDMK